MAYVGFSTGNFQNSKFSLNERIKFFTSLGDAIELFFETAEDLENYQLTDEIIKLISKYQYISVHAPITNVKYKSDKTTETIIKKLKYLCKKLSIKGIAIHPSLIEDFSKLEESGLPFLLENMGKRKSTGTHPLHFREYVKKFKFDFVFDVQHAFEHDSSMKLSKEIIKIMGNRLQHMHVSGCNDAHNHYPTFMSDNKENISKILKLKLPVPKLLEGIFAKNIKNIAINELKFIKSFEK